MLDIMPIGSLSGAERWLGARIDAAPVQQMPQLGI